VGTDEKQEIKFARPKMTNNNCISSLKQYIAIPLTSP